MIRAGELVIVDYASGRVGPVFGQVLSCTPRAELPDVAQLGAEARAILTEWDVSHVAMIGYKRGCIDVCFAALHLQGRWFDMQRQELSITPVRRRQRAS
jgi:hypothetical protein